MSGGLTRAAFALAPTRRRRWLWCAWWTAAPCERPFRPPDAWGGGARDEAEAARLAERAAGRPLERIDGRWAGAWRRVQAGLSPFPPSAGGARAPKVRVADPADPYALLGIAPTASLAEVKAAFRARALEHHPDRGGDADAFMAIKRAADAIERRRTRRPRGAGKRRPPSR